MTNSATRAGRSEQEDGDHSSTLPAAQREALRRAVRLERISLGVVATVVVLVGLTAGQSQAMRAAWIEDMLSLLPPLAFLVALRFTSRPPSPTHPYGHHRAIGVGHLVAAVALTGLATFILIDSGTGLVQGERPDIGTMSVLGTTFWSGWLMIAVMIGTSVPIILLGRAKRKLAPVLHDKILHTDAETSSADWQTAAATVAGLLGIAAGLWWADAAAAIVVSVGILLDGIRAIRDAVRDLTDSSATTTDGKFPHPVGAELDAALDAETWIADHAVRLRDKGHVLHADVFVVPQRDEDLTAHRMSALRQRLTDLDWRLDDLVVVPVETIDPHQAPRPEPWRSAG
jgi:cation diffusion facilitator family transporter